MRGSDCSAPTWQKHSFDCDGPRMTEKMRNKLTKRYCGITHTSVPWRQHVFEGHIFFVLGNTSRKVMFFFCLFFWPSLRYSTCRYKNKPAERNIYLEEFGRVYKCKSQCFGSRQKKSTWICSLASGDVLNSNTSTLLGSTFCESKEQLHILLLESFENTVLQLQVVSCEWGSMLVLLQLHMVKNKRQDCFDCNKKKQFIKVKY